MTSTDLASMTLKDLRQLASEHALPNRSRLAKQELIDALQHLIVNRENDQAARCEATKKPKKWQ